MSKDAENADQSNQAADSSESSTLETDIKAKLEKLQEGDVGETDDSQSDTNGDADASGSTDSETTDSDKSEDDSPILPSGHRRAALARGYTTEEIDQYLKTKPDEAIVRFGELFDEWQRENSDWSERGRQLKAAGQQESESGEDDTETPQTLQHYDAKALIEKHGNEELINDLVTPLNTVIDQVNDTVQRLSHSEEFLQGTEENALRIATQDFLKSKEMEPFKDTYGVEIKDLTDQQVAKRMKLFEQADIIAAGAVDHGVDITVQDALERAHVIVSQGTRDEAIRQTIRDSLEKRTKTLPSSHQQTSASDEDKPISDEELVTRTEARLQSLRNK